MTIREKIGSMVMAGFPSTEIDSEYESLLRDYKISNVILFAGNLSSAEQAGKLCADLRRLVETSAGVPALIAVDEEGGMVTRMPQKCVSFPGAMAVAATGNPKSAYAVGTLTARELRMLGMDLAPVLDINSNPKNPVIGVRSYGDNVNAASEYGIQMMKGLEDGGILPVVKHFPGYGETVVDAHLGLPSVEKDLEGLKKCEFIPFKRVFREGAEAVMTAHVLFPNVEPRKIPATMSKIFLTDILRGELGFKGLIITDCLEMDAVKKYYGPVKGAVAAVKSGADMIIVSHSAGVARDVCKGLEDAVASGEIPMGAVDASVKRIQRLKMKYGNLKREDMSGEKIENQLKALRSSAAAISVKTITLLSGTLPKLSGRTLFAGCLPDRLTPVSSPDVKLSFPKFMSAALGGDALETPINPTGDEIDGAAAQASSDKYDSIVIGTYNGNFYEGQIKMVNRLCGLNKNVVAVSLRNPYDLKFIDSRAVKLAAYEYTENALEAVAGILGGKSRPSGKMSVAL